MQNNYEKNGSVVISTQIACEIDICTLTSHRFLGQIFGLRKDGRGGAGGGNTVLQFYWDRKYSFAALLGRKIQCTVLLGQKKGTR